jgi:hypothetical protein
MMLDKEDVCAALQDLPLIQLNIDVFAHLILHTSIQLDNVLVVIPHPSGMLILVYAHLAQEVKSLIKQL